MKTSGFPTVTSINGKIVPLKDARISAFDNAVLYGEGLFETFLGIDERPIFLREHLIRLRRGAKLLGLNIPVPQKQLIGWITNALKAHPSHTKQLRLTLTAGESPRYTGHRGKPQVISGVAPYTFPDRPFKLMVADYRVDQDSEFRRIKTISYAIHAAALGMARRRKCDDALLMNERGKIAEASSANIFWVKKGRIFTPPVASGCLIGVTRAHVLEESVRLGIPIAEKDCTLEQLGTAD
ncbi:MAG TPA: aminotransferase class IV, partial [candidate division Zixibacteria bacterium]|nr:aminotransferase class IV [candidate division Zixibacteria bacterium]